MFSFIDYVLVACGIIPYYSLGKRIGINSFFTACIVGMFPSALLVAILANSSAGLIRPFILLSTIICYILLLYDYISSFKTINKKLFEPSSHCIILITIASIIFSLNIPQNVFLEYKSNGDILFNFNRHYSYFASPVIEMLNANYFSRLKLFNLMPFEWSTYHFFNASIKSLAQAFIPKPNLFTCIISQLVITIFILLSFCEIWLAELRVSLTCFIKITIWGAIGFSAFSNALLWNLYTNGALSVFAMVHIIFSAYRNRYFECIVFMFILGASAFRMIPISIILLLYVIGYSSILYSQEIVEKISSIRYREIFNNYLMLLTIVTFIMYNIITIMSGKPTEQGSGLFATQGYFYSGWFYILLVYKLISYFNINGFTVVVDYDIINKIKSNYFTSDLLALNVIVIVCIIILTLYKYCSNYRNNKFGRIYVTLVVLYIVFIVFLTSNDSILLHIVSMPYAALMLVILINTKINRDTKRFIFGLITASFIASLLYQYTKIDFAVKVPVTSITYDIMLWSILGIYILNSRLSDNGMKLLTVIAVSGVLIFGCSLRGMQAMPQQDNHSYQINITEVVRGVRADFVDSDNYLRGIPSDPDAADVYSALLGANLMYSNTYKTFMNYRFIGARP